MLSLNYINNNIKKVKNTLIAKNIDFDLNNIVLLDQKRKKLIGQVEQFKSERNLLNRGISKNSKDKQLLIEKMKVFTTDIKLLDTKLNAVLEELNDKLLYIPNVIHNSVPIGDENSNLVVREWGEKPNFDFKIKNHKELCEFNKLVDFKRSINMSGSGFPLYTNNGSKLERGLINFMLDVHSNNGYIELFPPFLVTSQSPRTTGNLPKFKEDMYYIENDDLYCIPTAEVPITNMHYNETLLEADLPKKYVSYSACFRREAGSYGKDTKGLLRLHQFNKVELVKFVNPKESYEELELLVNDAEKILQKLNLHYRVVSLASRDLSFSASKCYDIEVWSPFEKRYLEVSSCSNFESFQSMRGKIKYRNTKTNKLEYLHTLNGSGLATPRLFVCLIETYQNKDATISLPDILCSYLNMKTIDAK